MPELKMAVKIFDGGDDDDGSGFTTWSGHTVAIRRAGGVGSAIRKRFVGAAFV